MMKLRTSISLTIIILAAGFCPGLAGCVRGVDQARLPLPEIVWPPAPEIPRIRLVNTVSKPEDLQIRGGIFKRFLGYLVGKNEAAMVAPYGVETDAAGRLYVVDTFLRTVHVFGAAENVYYTFSTDKSKLMSPIDLAVDDAGGRIFVSDSQAGSVKIFKDRGKTFEGEIGAGTLERPTGIAINAKTAELIIVDTRLASIFRYDLGNLELKGRFGGSGAEQGRLNYPTNVFIDGQGSIYVTDALNFRIQVFSAGGRFIGGFGSAGDGPGYFARPRGIAVDSDGNIYVVDGLFDNIQIFSSDYKLLMAFGRPGRGYGEFWLPTGIFIAPDDTIYVSDHYNKRVQIFQYIKEDVSLK